MFDLFFSVSDALHIPVVVVNTMDDITYIYLLGKAREDGKNGV